MTLHSRGRQRTQHLQECGGLYPKGPLCPRAEAPTSFKYLKSI